MLNIKALSSILPYEFENYMFRLVSFSDTDWYIDNCMKPYYEEFMDSKFSQYKRSQLEKAFYNIIRSYVCKLESSYEGRLVLHDKSINDIVGGVTLFEKKLDNINVIELAYFILPKYQGNGIAYKMIKELIKLISNSNIVFDYITAVIREDNIKSLNLIKKIGFREYNTFKGKYKNNITFILERQRS